MDIFNALISDHAAIRTLLGDLRSETTNPPTKKEKLKNLDEWLKAHAFGEDRTIDAYGKRTHALRALSCEDQQEHAAIARLHQKFLRSTNPQLKQTRLHLLCHLIEAHLKEEEEEFFPLLKRILSRDEREKLGVRYQELTKGIDRLRPEVAGNVLGWITARPDPKAAETNLR